MTFVMYDWKHGTAADRAAEAWRLLAIINNSDCSAMTTKDQELVTGIQEKFDKYGENGDVWISPIQLRWLRDIKDRYL